MKRVILAVMLLTAVATGGVLPAKADGLNLSAISSAVDPLTGLKPDDWAKLAINVINGKAVIGKPFIYMINATGKELIAVTCDGKWQLVGPKPYIKDAPGNLPAWKVTIAPTDGFDGYCKTAIIAQDDSGTLYKATLVSVDGSFTNASSITFKNPQ
jgi:hypothetical protein